MRILQYPHPSLLQKAEVVDTVNNEIRRVLQKMAATMDANNGIGLAASQVGIPLRLTVVRINERYFQIINPEIEWESDGKEPGPEGCLSLPGETWEVIRAWEVVVKGLWPNGEEETVLANGLLARVFQHEIEHLDGVLINSKGRFLEKLASKSHRKEEGQCLPMNMSA